MQNAVTMPINKMHAIAMRWIVAVGQQADRLKGELAEAESQTANWSNEPNNSIKISGTLKKICHSGFSETKIRLQSHCNNLHL
jgi:hypothetical protein